MLGNHKIGDGEKVEKFRGRQASAEAGGGLTVLLAQTAMMRATSQLR